MLKRIFNSAVLPVLLMLAGAGAHAQSGEFLSYTPYSIFGIGDLSQQGSAYNRSMAGVGIASRNVRYLNSLNPAAAHSFNPAAAHSFNLAAAHYLNLNLRLFPAPGS